MELAATAPSPLLQAGWQHLQWVLRVVWLGLSTWQGHGKGTDT